MSLECVLLVDDDHIANYLNQLLLKRYVHKEAIHITNNGKMALEFIASYAQKNQNKCPDLIFLDLNMPVIDGFTFLENLFEMPYCNIDAVKVVVLTSSNYIKDMEKIKRIGDIEYLVKPLNEEKLKVLRDKLIL